MTASRSLLSDVVFQSACTTVILIRRWRCTSYLLTYLLKHWNCWRTTCPEVLSTRKGVKLVTRWSPARRPLFNVAMTCFNKKRMFFCKMNQHVSPSRFRGVIKISRRRRPAHHMQIGCFTTPPHAARIIAHHEIGAFRDLMAAARSYITDARTFEWSR